MCVLRAFDVLHCQADRVVDEMQARYVDNTHTVLVEIIGIVNEEHYYNSFISQKVGRTLPYELYPCYWHEIKIEM